jgi:hypothetical protein
VEAPETIAVHAPPVIIFPPVDMAPRLPSWFAIVGLVAILAIISEVHSICKYDWKISIQYVAGRKYDWKILTQYAGPVGEAILKKAIGLAPLVGATVLLYFMLYCPPIK